MMLPVAFVDQTIADDVERCALGELGPVVHLGEHAHRGARAEGDGSATRRILPGQHVEEMGLAGAVGADESDPFTVMDFLGERKEEIVDRHRVEFRHAPCGIGTSQPDVDLVIGYGWRRRSGGDELLPTSFGGVGLGRVLEILRGALLHDFHVMEKSSLFVVPTFQFVAELLLAFGTGLGEGRVRTTVDPCP